MISLSPDLLWVSFQCVEIKHMGTGGWSVLSHGCDWWVQLRRISTMKQGCLCGGVWRRNLEGTINSTRDWFLKLRNPATSIQAWLLTFAKVKREREAKWKKCFVTQILAWGQASIWEMLGKACKDIWCFSSSLCLYFTVTFSYQFLSRTGCVAWW